MVAFHPFDSAENALENILAITEHEMTSDLRVRIAFTSPVLSSVLTIVSCIIQTFIEANIPKGKKASQFPLGVVSCPFPHVSSNADQRH
jgi:hypothetical protein